MKLKPIILSALVLGSVSAQANCNNTYKGRSVCDIAQVMVRSASKNLPQQVNSYMRISSTFALGNTVVFNYTLDYSLSELNAQMAKTGYTLAQFKREHTQEIKNSVCSDSELKPLINAGLDFDYSYSLNDGYKLNNVEIYSCN